MSDRLSIPGASCEYPGGHTTYIPWYDNSTYKYSVAPEDAEVLTPRGEAIGKGYWVTFKWFTFNSGEEEVTGPVKEIFSWKEPTDGICYTKVRLVDGRTAKIDEVRLASRFEMETTYIREQIEDWCWKELDHPVTEVAFRFWDDPKRYLCAEFLKVSKKE